jgi:hypothetical protein
MPEHRCSDAPHIGPPELLLDAALLDELLLDELLDAAPLDELLDEPFPLDEELLVMAAPPLPLELLPVAPSPPEPSPPEPSSPSKSGPEPVAHAPTNPSTNTAKPSFLVFMPASAHANVSERIFAWFIQEGKPFHPFQLGFPEQTTRRTPRHDGRIETKQGWYARRDIKRQGGTSE